MTTKEEHSIRSASLFAVNAELQEVKANLFYAKLIFHFAVKQDFHMCDIPCEQKSLAC